MIAALLRPFLVLLVAMAAAQAAPSAPAGLVTGDRAAVVSVVDGDTVVLEDGRQVRLVGTQAPKLPLGRPNFPTWPLAEPAKAALEALVQGRAVELRYGGARRDRHGRELAHLVRDDGLWVQGTMIEQGWARVYSFPDNRGAVRELLALEGQARAARRGIWNHPHYAVRSAEQPGESGSFQLVEGVVREVGKTRSGTYLNFGQDWKSDFTIFIQSDDLASFRALPPERLAGQRVRVRGWLRERNGPMIEASHPEQIEVLK